MLKALAQNKLNTEAVLLSKTEALCLTRFFTIIAMILVTLFMCHLSPTEIVNIPTSEVSL
jgi:hypothetical protein